QGIDELYRQLKAMTGEKIQHEKRLHLLAEKAFHLIEQKRMRDIDKKMLKEKIRAAGASFNLYRFVTDY
nr:methylmalonyl Co-A mutase-associated GTPase MeaB [Ferruginibacter sp.]